jgi:hypothetical protein
MSSTLSPGLGFAAALLSESGSVDCFDRCVGAGAGPQLQVVALAGFLDHQPTVGVPASAVDSKPVRSLLRQHHGRACTGILIKAAGPHPARGRLEGDLDNLLPPLYLDGRGLSVEASTVTSTGPSAIPEVMTAPSTVGETTPLLSPLSSKGAFANSISSSIRQKR